MKDVKAILVIDFGNSSTKACLITGRNADGSFIEHSIELSNTFAQIDDKEPVVPSDYTEDNSIILDVDTLRVDPKDTTKLTTEGPIRNLYVTGLLQKNEYTIKSHIVQPKGRLDKYSLDSTYLTARLVLYKAMRILMDVHNVTDINELNATFRIAALLPPGQVNKGQDAMKTIFNTINTVNLYFPKVSFKVNIEDVHTYPEGSCAYLGIVMEDYAHFRVNYAPLNKENVIVFDIGAGTTDVVVIKKGHYIQRSAMTVRMGGNNIVSKVVNYLMKDSIYATLDRELVKAAVPTGQIKIGTKVHDITETIDHARSDVASAIVDRAVQNYIEALDDEISMSEIGYILVCGGGSIGDNSLTNLSDDIVTKYREEFPDAQVIDMPNVNVRKVDADGNEIIVEEKMSPRYMNLIGAVKITEKFSSSDNFF